MEKGTKNQNHNSIPDFSKSMVSKSITGLQELTLTLKNKFTMTQYDFADVIQNMMKDLKKMESNPKLSQRFIEQKRHEIERLINFNNTADLIFQKYENYTQLLQLTNAIIERTFLESSSIDEMILRHKEYREEFSNP